METLKLLVTMDVLLGCPTACSFLLHRQLYLYTTGITKALISLASNFENL
jgi:hypothetical protein